jgi:hypothetical protein
VIGERFDDLTITGASARARPDDTHEFFFERRQLLDADVHFSQMAPRNPVGVVARALGVIRQIEERSNIVELKPERAGVPDEG